MAEELPAACMKVAAAARELGTGIDIRVMASSTRTAEEAAASLGSSVAQIVKSLIFRKPATGEAVLFLVSGPNRLDEKLVSAALGIAIARADADFVREKTGFAIGGVPPFGHATPMACFMDEDLMTHETVYAAAGTPLSIFAIPPAELARVTSARVMAVCRKPG